LRSLSLSKICILCLLVGLISGLAHTAYGFSFSFSSSSSSSSSSSKKKSTATTTNRPWGNIGPFKQAPMYEPPAVPANQYYPASSQPYYPASSQPANNWYAAQAQAPVKTAATSSEPRVEVSVSSTTLYEQQNVVYTARVISSNNLKTLDPVMPGISGAVLEKIDGPVASSSPSHEIVNTYHFKLTPLQSGEIVIPAITFKGTHAAGRHWSGFPGVPQVPAEDDSFTVSSGKPLTFHVMMADPAVQPWLPLNDLKLRSSLSEEQPFKEGKPVTLTLELTAKGALGEQLPSLEQQLPSDQYRIYRDAVSVKNGISRDGNYLIGTRKETYTLIPLKDGWVRLPRITVSWWDIDKDEARIAGLPDQAGENFAAGNRLIEAVTGRNDVFSGLFWAPLLMTLGLIAGYWLGVWSRTRPLIDAVRKRVAATLRGIWGHGLVFAGAGWRKISPVVYINKLRYSFAVLMPKPVRVWMCTRCLDPEETPETWCLEFKQRVCQHLQITPHTPLPAIAEKIIAANPQAEPARIRALVQSLDGAIYGGKPLDFVVWKRDFKNQLRPRLYRRHRTRSHRSRATLPALNPRSA
jgi:hypothetical protein